MVEIPRGFSHPRAVRTRPMQVHRTIDEIKGIVCTTITGEISLRDIQADMARLASEPSYRPQMRGLIDLRQATSLMSTDEMLTLTQLIKSSPRTVSGARRALLVGSDLMYGLYRMFESFSSGGTVHYHVFFDENEARQWLEEE